MDAFSQQILRTDASGLPLEWVDFRAAVKLHLLGQVVYTLGHHLFDVHGGINALTHERSIVPVHSIIATRSHGKAWRRMNDHFTPPLNNRALFQRDDHVCLYCGETFLSRQLSRDHVEPLSQGGRDDWNNVVTACVRCNHRKAGRTPEQAGMQLLAIPFTPTHAEYVYLEGHNVLADQMSFLRAHFPRESRLRRKIDRMLDG